MQNINVETQLQSLLSQGYLQSNPHEIIITIQTILQSSNLSVEMPLFDQMEILAKQHWYLFAIDQQFNLYNLFFHFNVESKHLEKEFEELSNELFFSNQ